MTEYRTTKQECSNGIKGVCSQCGGELEPLETVDNARNPTYWSGCSICMRFDNGVDKEIYQTASRLVDSGYEHYSHIQFRHNDTEDQKKYKREQQISGACGLVAKILRIHNG